MADHEDPGITKLRLDHELGRYGLQGTFYGTVFALGAIVVIAIAQLVTGRNIVEGWPFAAMVFTITIPIIFFGAFIFNRIVSIEGKMKKEGIAIEAKTGGARKRDGV